MELIDANAYFKKICTYAETGCGSCKVQTACPLDEPIIKIMPEIHGKWEDCSNGWMCSICNHDFTYDTNYCPNCGAKMDLKEEENNEN